MLCGPKFAVEQSAPLEPAIDVNSRVIEPVGEGRGAGDECVVCTAPFPPRPPPRAEMHTDIGSRQ